MVHRTHNGALADATAPISRYASKTREIGAVKVAAGNWNGRLVAKAVVVQVCFW